MHPHVHCSIISIATRGSNIKYTLDGWMDGWMDGYSICVCVYNEILFSHLKKREILTLAATWHYSQ